jgi:hypothetical protein
VGSLLGKTTRVSAKSSMSQTASKYTSQDVPSSQSSASSEPAIPSPFVRGR